MHRKSQLAIGIGLGGMLVVAALVPIAWAASGTPITVTFRDAFPTDQIGSDGKGAYSTGGAVEAVFDASGDLHFYTDLNGRQGGRTLSLNFADCINTCSPPFTKATLVDAFMSTSGVASGGHNVAGLPGMTPGAVGTANLNINFPGWFVRFNSSNYPGSTTVTVTRIDQQNWTITADSATQVAGLIKLSSNGKTETDVGEFHMPTEITINCPSC